MESWKAIQGFEGYYEVSTYGKVRSLDRVVRFPDGRKSYHKKGRILTVNKKKGYMIVALWKNGAGCFRYVHRLVAEAFVPNPKRLREVNHKDLNKQNNKKSNLEWRSSSGNKKHAVLNGVEFNPKPKRGEERGTARLTWLKVRKIRKLYATGVWTQTQLAEMFSVTQTLIYYIVRDKIWKE